MSWNSHTWRSRNWEGLWPFFLHGESKGTLVNIGKNILYKEDSKKPPNNTKNQKNQPNKTISKSSLKCNDQKNFTMVDTLEKSLLGWKLSPATILKVCKGLACVHKTLTAFLHFLLTYRVKILDKLLKRKGFIIFLTWSEFHSQAKKKKKKFLHLTSSIADYWNLLSVWALSAQKLVKMITGRRDDANMRDWNRMIWCGWTWLTQLHPHCFNLWSVKDTH